MHDLFDLCGTTCGCGCDDTAGCGCASAATMPLIGDRAPEFTAQTTNGPIHFPDDYAGKWVVLFSHPSDFTPVCTSEFMAFQELSDELHELNTELIGLSVGSVSSHLAWINAIRDIKYKNMENLEITFPVIDDVGMHVAQKYGMIHPNASDTHAVRAVFIIDPNGIIRAILYYPLTTGRNFNEILRMVIALQTTDAFHASTPADWTPGDDVLVGAPTTSAAMRELMRGQKGRNTDTKAWFFSFKKLPSDMIFAKIGQKRTSKPTRKKK